MQWTITGHVHAEDVDWKTAASVKISDASIQSVKCSLAELTDTVWLIRHRKDQRNRLKVSSSKSWKRKSDLEHLSHTEDHLLFLQGLRSLNTAATTKESLRKVPLCSSSSSSLVPLSLPLLPYLIPPSVSFLCFLLCHFFFLANHFPPAFPFSLSHYRLFLRPSFFVLFPFSPSQPPSQHQGVDAQQRSKAGKGRSGGLISDVLLLSETDDVLLHQPSFVNVLGWGNDTGDAWPLDSNNCQ